MEQLEQQFLTKKRFLSIAIFLILLLILSFSGCNQGNQQQSSSSNAGGAAGNTQSIWEKIQEEGVIIVGNSPDYEPFEYEDGQGNVIGFDIDLLGLICGELGVEYELRSLSFENIETAVQTGQVHIGLSCFSITPERLQTFDFTIPYFSSGQAIAVNPDSGYTKIEDLNGKTITVGMGTSGMEAAEANIADANIIGIDNYALAFMQLKNKGCDAAVADLPVVRNYAAKDGFLILEEILSYEDNAILVSKGNADLVEALNGAIRSLIDDGQVEELISKWLVSEE